MSLPTFLILGAMKAGTTALHDALVQHPDVFMPPNKEPDALADRAVETTAGFAEYEALFARGPGHKARGEASTSFTKRHLYDDVPARTRRLLGDSLDLIFIARQPIDRIVSHVNHERLAGREFDRSAQIDVGSKFVETSRYAHQLEPWIEEFGRERLLVIDFADLISDPEAVLDKSFRHIRVDPGLGPKSLVQSNAASSARVESALIQRAVTKAGWYEATLKNWVPPQLRRSLRNRLVKESDFRPLERPDVSITDRALDLLEADRSRLAELTGLVMAPVQ